MRILQRDSLFFSKKKLMDYSILVILVNRNIQKEQIMIKAKKH